MSLIIFRTHSKLLLKSFGKNKLVFISYIITNFFNRQTGADQKTGCFMHLIINQEGLCRYSKLFLKGTVQIGTADSDIICNIRNSDSFLIHVFNIFNGKLYVNTGAVSIFSTFFVLCRLLFMKVGKLG